MSYVNRKKSQRWISSDMWICTDHIPAPHLPVNQAVCWYCKKERPPLEGRGLTPIAKVVSEKNHVSIKKEKSTPQVPPMDVYQPKSSRPLPARPSKTPTIETPVSMVLPPVKKAPPKPVKKAPVKKSPPKPVKKAPVKKAPVKKSPPKPVKKAPVKKAPAKKAPAKKAPAKKAPAKKAPVVEVVVKTPSTSQCAWSGCSNPNTGTSQYCSRTCSNKNAHARQAERRRNSKKV